MTYREFLETKIELATESGFSVDPAKVNKALKPHQRDAVMWALRGGKRALFESFGLGKTVQEMEFCHLAAEHTGGRALIVLPLGVKQEFTHDAMDNNLADGSNDGTVEKNVEYIEKTYFKHVDKNFIGVIVGYKDIVVKGYLDAVYQDECDVGVGVIPEAFYVSKRAKETVKCAVVYYANNMKHYVPLEDLEVLP